MPEGFDLSTPVGKAMFTMMAGLASPQKNLIAERRRQESNTHTLKASIVADQLRLPLNRRGSC